MGSIMTKELVSVKGLNGCWDLILDVRLSANLNLTDATEMIQLVKDNYHELSNCEYSVEDDEIYVFVENMTQINPGTECKIN